MVRSMMPQTIASRTASNFLAAALRRPFAATPRPYPGLPRTLQPSARRFAHAIPKPPTSNAADATKTPLEPTPRKLLEPHYQLHFTCVPCSSKSSHVVSKQAYHKGSVLISCPTCRNRHIISDNLNIFGDRKINVEQLLREKGQLVKRGTLGEDGDIEFWQDDSAESGSEPDASKSSLEEDGENIRHISSLETNPTPSPSAAIRGDSNARPSVQGASVQQPTPPTRRQFHTSRRMLDETALSRLAVIRKHLANPKHTEFDPQKLPRYGRGKLPPFVPDPPKPIPTFTSIKKTYVRAEPSLSFLYETGQLDKAPALAPAPAPAPVEPFKRWEGPPKAFPGRQSPPSKDAEEAVKPVEPRPLIRKVWAKEDVLPFRLPPKPEPEPEPEPEERDLVRRIGLGSKFQGVRFEKIDGPRIMPRSANGKHYDSRPPGGGLPANPEPAHPLDGLIKPYDERRSLKNALDRDRDDSSWF